MKPRSQHLVIASLLGLACLAAQAQYKIVGPDGKVTYTDRPTATSQGDKVTPVRGGSVSDVPDSVQLPPDLRQAVQRYPVVLYTTPECGPCADARALLRARGVPFSERLVTTNEDSESLQRLTGAREAPTLTLGAQTLRGLSSDTWNAYLDSAGYPRESKLPANYNYPVATPLTERRPLPVAQPSRPQPPLIPQASEGTPANSSGQPNPGIRF